MQNKTKLKELEKKLPRGAKAKISKKCKISRTTVTQFFKGSKMPSNETVRKILIATQNIIEEYQKESNDINLMIDKIKL